MKNQPTRRDRGFTLVELLVVIAIIAVLASVGFAAGTAAINRAKKTTTLATASALESAVNNFYTEYGGLPTQVSTDEDTDAPPINTKQDIDFLKVLTGTEVQSGSSLLNTRGVKFLSVKEGKNDKNGMMYSSQGIPTGLYDPWGGALYVLLDTGYNERLTIKRPNYNKDETLNGRRVAAWSLGADGAKGGTSKPGDDVITW